MKNKIGILENDICIFPIVTSVICEFVKCTGIAWHSNTNGVYMLENCSECCVMLARALDYPPYTLHPTGY